jgi:hypothetical protein
MKKIKMFEGDFMDEEDTKYEESLEMFNGEYKPTPLTEADVAAREMILRAKEEKDKILNHIHELDLKREADTEIMCLFQDARRRINNCDNAEIIKISNDLNQKAMTVKNFDYETATNTLDNLCNLLKK